MGQLGDQFSRASRNSEGQFLSLSVTVNIVLGASPTCPPQSSPLNQLLNSKWPEALSTNCEVVKSSEPIKLSSCSSLGSDESQTISKNKFSKASSNFPETSVNFPQKVPNENSCASIRDPPFKIPPLESRPSDLPLFPRNDFRHDRPSRVNFGPKIKRKLKRISSMLANIWQKEEDQQMRHSTFKKIRPDFSKTSVSQLRSLLVEYPLFGRRTCASDNSQAPQF